MRFTRPMMLPTHRPMGVTLRTAALRHAAAVHVEPQPVRYRLRQSFRYDYDAPARSLLHRLVVVPPRVHGDQRLLLGGVVVSDPSAQVDWSSDGHGNSVCTVRAAVVPRTLEMHVAVVVERYGGAAPVPAGLLTDPRLTQAELADGGEPGDPPARRAGGAGRRRARLGRPGLPAGAGARRLRPGLDRPSARPPPRRSPAGRASARTRPT